jgi:putative FmdB family regulatory protein
MPTYSYFCEKCKNTFELFFSLREYKETVKCQKCKNTCSRHYEDLLTINSSVKKSDTELKTIGDLANRNRDRMSEEQRQELTEKHNSYKDNDLIKELPKGMSRIKKSKTKTKWR